MIYLGQGRCVGHMYGKLMSKESSLSRPALGPSYSCYRIRPHFLQRQRPSLFLTASLPMSRTSSGRPPPRPPPYQGRSGRLTSQEASVTGTKEARERFRSGSPTRANTSACRSRGGSARPPRGRSISVTVCQYAAPKDKKTETLKVKQRPLSLSLTPASSTNSVASSSQDTEEFWGRYRRGPAPISIVQLFRRAVGLGQSQVGRGGEEEPTYAEIYRGGETGGTLPVRGRGRRRPPPPPAL